MTSSIEPPRTPRTLVLCFDGTADEYSAQNTNVVKFFGLLKKNDSDEQLCYYQAGIGTFFAPGVVTPLLQWVAKVADQTIAWYLDAHVMGGYRFLMQNYRVGDKICIFGFSRGAYTARALGGMLHKVGLLPRDNQEQILFAYKLYTRQDATGTRLSAGFKKTFSHNVQIEFMGVWETVSGVGVIMSKNLPFTDSNRSVKTFRHALSLDEHRARFKPNLYHRPSPNSGPASADVERASASAKSSKNEKGSLLRWPKSKRKHSHIGSVTQTDEDSWSPTDVLEVWFSGVHSDVGGGEVVNENPHSLSNIPLRWMVRQVLNSNCGILFLDHALDALQLDADAPVNPDPVTTTADAADALEPIHDQLVLKKAWWLLEIIPMKYSWQDVDCKWHSTFRWNLGRGRVIVDREPNFHATVRERINNASSKYKPKAKWDGKEKYVS